MKRFGVVVVILLVGGSLFAQQNVPPLAKAFTAPDIRYDAVPDFLKLPAGLYLGEGIGMRLTVATRTSCSWARSRIGECRS
jgi:hypothetical protein